MHRLKTLSRRIGGAIHMLLSKKKGRIMDIRYKRSKGAQDVTQQPNGKGA